MISPNKLMAWVIAIVVLSLCAGALLSGAWLGSQAAERHVVPAKFKVGDCFRASPPMHRWQPADGMIFNLDATAYLVVYAIYLKSRSPIDPSYAGIDHSIAAFDEQFDVVPCPGRWQ